MFVFRSTIYLLCALLPIMYMLFYDKIDNEPSNPPMHTSFLLKRITAELASPITSDETNIFHLLILFKLIYYFSVNIKKLLIF